MGKLAYLRKPSRLGKMDSNRVRVIEGDVLDKEKLKQAMIAQDVIYANLAGNLEQMAKNIVEAMNATGVKRLIFISSMGIYGEVPGQRYSLIVKLAESQGLEVRSSLGVSKPE